jgi:VanZ family protein
MKPPVIRILLPILLFLWVILITILSISPADQLSSGFFNIKHLDKLAHFMFYFVFAILLFRILKDYMSQSQTSLVLIAALIPIVYSGGIELFQEYLTTTREADFWDFLMNIIGASTAVLLGKKLIKLQFQKQYVREFS